ncbi:DtxR family transcriptional regulator, partial [candidate division CSSED10-310 bacterium]
GSYTMKIGTVSESLEDYLLIIFQLIQDKKRARVKDIAEKKGVKMASVSAALKRLARERLIDYTARECVEITKEGENLVRRLINRRDQVKRFLNKVLGLSEDLAQRDAGGMEHHLSLETLDRLAAFQGFLENSTVAAQDIPGQFGHYYSQSLVGTFQGRVTVSDQRTLKKELVEDLVQDETLLDLAPGERGIIKRLIAKSAIRQRLVDMGFLPNVEVLMERVAPLGDPIEVKIKGFHISLRNEEAARITIKSRKLSDEILNR